MSDAGSRIYGPAQPGTSNGILYTAPALTTCVVRHIHVCNTTSAAATVSLAINGTAATAANCWLSGFSVPGNGSYDWSGFLYLEIGDTIQGLQGTSGALTVTIAGVLTT